MSEENTNTEFWPESVQDSPGTKFFLTFVMLPALLVFIAYAYLKTVLFGYNAITFYRRFTKKDDTGEFEIPTKNVRRRRRGQNAGKNSKNVEDTKAD